MNADEFDAVLDEADQEPLDTHTVTVCLKPSVAVKRAELLKAVEKARKADAEDTSSDERLGADPEPVTTRTDAARAELEAYDDEVVSKALVKLKFTRMEGDKWASLTLAYPARLTVEMDERYGYNVDALTLAAARISGVRVDADGEHMITMEQWDRLYKRLAGHDVEKIRDAVWTLNVWLPSQRVDVLVKDSGAA